MKNNYDCQQRQAVFLHNQDTGALPHTRSHQVSQGFIEEPSKTKSYTKENLLCYFSLKSLFVHCKLTAQY